MVARIQWRTKLAALSDRSRTELNEQRNLEQLYRESVAREQVGVSESKRVGCAVALTRTTQAVQDAKTRAVEEQHKKCARAVAAVGAARLTPGGMHRTVGIVIEGVREDRAKALRRAVRVTHAPLGSGEEAVLDRRSSKPSFAESS